MPDALTMLPLRCPEGCGRIEVLDQEDGSWRKRLDCMLEHGEVEDVEEVCRLILHPPCAAHFFLLDLRRRGARAHAADRRHTDSLSLTSAVLMMDRSGSQARDP